MKTVLLLIYLALSDAPRNEPQLEIYRRDFKSVEACEAAGSAKIAAQVKDPRFIGGIFVDCITMPLKNKL